jgi:DNA-binding transcriptional ArsR family regulator
MLRRPVDGARLDILEWLKDPAAHFPPPCAPAGPAAHGADADAVAARLGVPRRVAETHLALLTAVGLLRTGRVRGRCGDGPTTGVTRSASPKPPVCSKRAGSDGPGLG